MPLLPGLFFEYGVDMARVQKTMAEPGFREMANVFIIPSGEKAILHEAPLQKHLRDGQMYRFRIGCNKEVASVAVKVNEEMTPLTPRDGVFEGDVEARRGEMTLMMQPRSAAEGRHYFVLKYQVE